MNRSLNFPYSPVVGQALRLCLLALAGLLPHAPLLAAPDAPALMVVVGDIRPGPLAPGVEARPPGRVLMFSSRDGLLVGDGEVTGPGRYVVSASRLTSFNGTPVVLELQQGRKRYALLPLEGSQEWFTYRGRTLPDRTPLHWRIGTQTAELSAQEAATPQAQRLTRQVEAPCDETRDVNRDGRCDEADWAILRLYGGGTSRVSP